MREEEKRYKPTEIRWNKRERERKRYLRGLGKAENSDERGRVYETRKRRSFVG
jgi:hypothetical protein